MPFGTPAVSTWAENLSSSPFNANIEPHNATEHAILIVGAFSTGAPAPSGWTQIGVEYVENTIYWRAYEQDLPTTESGVTTVSIPGGTGTPGGGAFSIVLPGSEFGTTFAYLDDNTSDTNGTFPTLNGAGYRLGATIIYSARSTTTPTFLLGSGSATGTVTQLTFQSILGAGYRMSAHSFDLSAASSAVYVSKWTGGNASSNGMMFSMVERSAGDVTVTIPDALTVTAKMEVPVVTGAGGVTITAPSAMTATAQIEIAANVSIDSSIDAVAMDASAAMPVPTVVTGVNALVTALGAMTASAYISIPSTLGKANVLAVTSTASAVMLTPSLSGTANVTVTVPAAMTATATVQAPSVTSGVSSVVTVPSAMSVSAVATVPTYVNDGVGYTPWMETRRNYLLDPQATNIGASNWFAAGGVAHSIINGVMRITRTSTAVAATYINRNLGAMPQGFSGQQWAFALEMRASVPTDVVLGFVQNNGTTSLNTLTATVGTSWQRYEDDGTLSVAWTGQILSPRIGQSLGNAGTGDWVEVRYASLELAPTAGIYFDGSQPASTLTTRSRWLGSANGSASVLEERVLIQNVSVAAFTMTATAQLPTPSVSAGGSIGIAAPTLTATAAFQAPTVTGKANVITTVVTTTASAAMQVPVVTGHKNVMITSVTLTASAGIPVATISGKANVSTSTATASAQFRVPTVVAAGNATVSATTFAATASMWIPVVTGKSTTIFYGDLAISGIFFGDMPVLNVFYGDALIWSA